MKNKIQTAILLLAAGRSSRMGSPKQLVKIGGIPLLQIVINNIQSAHYDVFVVTGCYREEISKNIDFTGTSEILNHSWEEGIGSSIRLGVQVLKSENKYKRLIVCVGDQLFLTNRILMEIVETSNKFPDHIVVSKYGTASGPPVLFPSRYFIDLLKLTGDKGAKSVIKAHKDKIINVSFEEGIIDIDTRDDIENIEK